MAYSKLIESVWQLGYELKISNRPWLTITSQKSRTSNLIVSRESHIKCEILTFSFCENIHQENVVLLLSMYQGVDCE